MKRHEAEKLIDTIKGFIDDDRSAPAHTKPMSAPAQAKDQGAPAPVGKLAIDRDQLEAIYLELKNRLLDDLRTDPILLQLIAQRPELIVEIEPIVVTLEASTLKGRVARLLAAGWFKEKRATSAVRKELARTGPDPGGGGTLSEKLKELQRDGFLTDENGWLEAPGMKVSEKRIER